MRSPGWWQDWRWIASSAAFVLAVAALLFGVAQYRGLGEVQSVKKIAENVQTTTDQTNAIAERLDHNQAGIDELVAFVHEVQAQQGQDSQGQSQVVQTILDLLCASSDPVRVEACAKLTGG